MYLPVVTNVPIENLGTLKHLPIGPNLLKCLPVTETFAIILIG